MEVVLKVYTLKNESLKKFQPQLMGTSRIVKWMRRTIFPGNSPSTFKRTANLSNLVFIEPRQEAQNNRHLTSSAMACSFGLLNCQSVCNKSVILKDYIVDRNFDIFAITETWLRSADPDEVVIGDLVPTGINSMNTFMEEFS